MYMNVGTIRDKVDFYDFTGSLQALSLYTTQKSLNKLLSLPEPEYEAKLENQLPLSQQKIC